MGAILTANALPELPAFFFFGRILAALGMNTVLLTAAGTLGLRIWAYSVYNNVFESCLGAAVCQTAPLHGCHPTDGCTWLCTGCLPSWHHSGRLALPAPPPPPASPAAAGQHQHPLDHSY